MRFFPNLEAANLSMTLLKELNSALPVRPILMGTRQPAHILAPTVTSRGIVNMVAIAANEAIRDWLVEEVRPTDVNSWLREALHLLAGATKR